MTLGVYLVNRTVALWSKKKVTHTPHSCSELIGAGLGFLLTH